VDDDALIELGAWHAPGRDPRGRYVTVAYRADLPHRATATAADDAADARRWPVDALDGLDIALDHRRLITRALAPRYSARPAARRTAGVQAAGVALAGLDSAFDRRRITARALASRYSARSTARGTVGVQAAVVADTTVVQTWAR